MPGLFQALRDRGDLAWGCEQDKSLVRLLSRACSLHDGSGTRAYKGPALSLMLCCEYHLDIQSFLNKDSNLQFVLGPTNPVVTLALPSGSSYLERRLNRTPISGHETCYEEVN